MSNTAFARYVDEDLRETIRLRDSEAHARLVALSSGMPALLIHNSRPGMLARCHSDAFARNGFDDVEAVLNSYLVVSYRDVDTVRKAMGTLQDIAAGDPDSDLAAAVLTRGYDATGSRIRM